MLLDVNKKEITLGCKVADLTEGWGDEEPKEVFADGEELAVNVDGTTIYLSEVETEQCCLIVE